MPLLLTALQKAGVAGLVSSSLLLWDSLCGTIAARIAGARGLPITVRCRDLGLVAVAAGTGVAATYAAALNGWGRVDASGLRVLTGAEHAWMTLSAWLVIVAVANALRLHRRREEVRRRAREDDDGVFRYRVLVLGVDVGESIQKLFSVDGMIAAMFRR